MSTLRKDPRPINLGWGWGEWKEVGTKLQYILNLRIVWGGLTPYKISPQSPFRGTAVSEGNENGQSWLKLKVQTAGIHDTEICTQKPH